MFRYFLVAAGLLVSITAISQKLGLVNSGEILEAGKAAYDSGNYKRAIHLYLSIHERDTNYVPALAELAITYLASEEYPKAIESVEKGLAIPSTYRAHLIRSKAIALDRKGDFQKSVEQFEKAIEEYPLDAVLIYNYGITLFNAKDYGKAKDQFLKALSINPFHAGSHRTLARIAMLEGRKTHGMMAMGIYLSINPSDNDQLVMINNFVLNQIAEESSISPSGKNTFEKLDQILRAKMAMDKNFKSNYPFDFAIVRQFEMLLQQLDLGGGETGDPMRNLYVPIYKDIVGKGYVDAFIYNLVKSTGNDQVKKWSKKNDKALNAFYDGTGAFIRTLRTHPVIPKAFGLDDTYTTHYTDDGRLNGVGRKSEDGTMTGKWFFFHSNMERSAEGSFDAKGNKIGTWKYFHDTGKLSKVENYDSGEMIFYHPEGTIYQHFFLVGDSIEGDAEVFYPCGSIREKYVYKSNNRHGKAFSYFPDGKVQSEYNYLNGKLDGEYRTFFEDGRLMSVSTYKDGLAEGPYKKFFANGKTETTGQYINDELEGEWSYFYMNGKPDRKGSYKKSKGDGEWKFYNERGEMVEKRIFNSEGNLHGENTFYENGKPYYVRTYKNGIVVGYVFFDDKGVEISRSGKDNGTFSVKLYYPTGELNGEGSFDKGNLHGVWRYFHRFGGLRSEYNYKDGILEGKGIDYYPDGTKQSEASYANDQLHGYYQSFHKNGQVSAEGWYQNGEKQQRWLTYYPDGTIENDDFFLNGSNTTSGSQFAVDGKLMSTRVYDSHGNLTSVVAYGPNGKPESSMKESGKRHIYESIFGNKKVQSHFELECGSYYGTIARYFPDGKPFYSYRLLNGKRDGKFIYYDMRNQVERSGTYIDGWAEGEWRGYENGKPDYVGRYFNNKFDSTWTYYLPDGKVWSFTNYMRGLRHGLSRVHNLQGGVAMEKMFENGDLVAYRTTSAEGVLGEWTRFTGDAVLISYYPNGAKAVEEEYKNGYLSGTRRQFYPDGKIFGEFNFKVGDYAGPFVVYYPNGKIKERGEYRFDELHGKVEAFNEDGTLAKSENYVDGVQSGKAAIYEKGVKTREYTFWGINVYE